MKILYKDLDVTSLVLSYTKKADFNEGYFLGNVPSYEIDLELNNLDGTFNDLDDAFFIYEDGETLTGKFTVYEKPEKYTSVINLVCYDNVMKLHVAYESNLNYESGVTIYQQLEEMATLSGIEIDSSNLPPEVRNKVVAWYDNTLMIVNYIGWIAEISGMNASSNADGTIVFKTVTTDGTDFTVDVLGDFESEEMYHVSRVCFDNGLVKYETGTDEYNTLYISPNNPYVDDLAIIEYIYRVYKDFSFMSVGNVKLFGNRHMRLGDLIAYNEEPPFMIMSLTATEYGGEALPTYQIEGLMQTKNEELIENRVNTDIKIKRLQVLYDTSEARLQIESKRIDGLEEQQANFIVDLDGIRADVSNSLTEDDVRAIAEATVDLSSANLEIKFKEETQQMIEESVGTATNEITAWFNFSKDGLEIGKTSSDDSVESNNYVIALDNEKMSFKDKGKEIAYLSNQELQITRANVLDSLRIGNYAFIPRSNGSIDFKKVRDS